MILMFEMLAILLLAAALAAAVVSWFTAPGLWASILIGMARRRSGLASQDIDVGGIHWHYLHGGNGPLLLLLHGFGADSSCWLRLAPLLRPHFSLLIPDLPGFGESERPENLPFAIPAQAGRLAKFLDALGVEKCIVAGNSMGGYLATQLAADDSRRVPALWLLAPLGVRNAPLGQVLQAIDSGDPGFLQISSERQFRERIVRTMFSQPLWIPGPLVSHLARIAIAMKDVAPRMLAEVRFDSEPLESIAGRVIQPTLLQWGSDDQVVNPAGLPVLQQALRDAASVLMKDCGHLAMLERPRESARCFLDFLDERGLRTVAMPHPDPPGEGLG